MDILQKLKMANAFDKCEKVAEVTWDACMKERNKPPTDAGCLHLKDFARITCIGDFKKKLTEGNQ